MGKVPGSENGYGLEFSGYGNAYYEKLNIWNMKVIIRNSGY